MRSDDPGAIQFVRRGTARVSALRLNAVAELFVAASALLVPRELALGRVVLQHVSSAAAWQSSPYYVRSAMWMGATIVPWCTAMGATFPLLLAAIRSTTVSTRAFSYLDLANVLGALLGTLASAFVLIDLLGFRGTLYAGCVLNAALAVPALHLSVTTPDARPAARPSRSSSPPQRLYGFADEGILLLLFTTGLVGMGIEVMPWLSERWAAGVLCLPLFGVAALVVWNSPARAEGRPWRRHPKRTYVVAGVTAIVVLTLSHDFETRYDDREVRRDYAATVIATGKDFARRLRVNGVGMTSLTPITKYMTHLPLALMDRPPRDGLVICFGMGTSFRPTVSWNIPSTPDVSSAVLASHLPPAAARDFVEWGPRADAREQFEEVLSREVSVDPRDAPRLIVPVHRARWETRHVLTSRARAQNAVDQAAAM